MLNPIRNIERAPGPGGPSFAVGLGSMPKTIDPARRKPHNYPVKRSSPTIAVHLAIPKLAAGGDIGDPDEQDEQDEQGGQDEQGKPDPEDLMEPNDQLSPEDQQMKEIVVEAMAALRGQHPDPAKAIKRFVDAFGEDELEELKQMMTQEPEPDDELDDTQGSPAPPPPAPGAPPQGGPPQGGPPPSGMQVGGLLHGPGAGQDDQIEAQTPGGRRVLLSDGEYVIDAPTVAALGDGSTDAGARRLDHFRKAVRSQSYGHDQQAKPLSKGGKLALLEALNR